MPALRPSATWGCLLLAAVACERLSNPSPGPVEVSQPAAGEGAVDPKTGADEEEPFDPGAPVTLTAVAQAVIGPAVHWRFDPEGRYVAWKNEGQCGLWRYDSGAFMGYFEHTAEGPCERWPGGRTRLIETEAVGPAGARATVHQTRLSVVAADKTKLLDVTCEKCQRYRAIAWSPDGTQIAAARSGPWGVDLWSVAEQKIIDRIDLDAHGKETDIGVLWGAAGMFAFVSHAYDPNEGKYGREDFGMESYVHVHGPAVTAFRLPLPRPPDRPEASAEKLRDILNVDESLRRLVIDPRLGAVWVEARSEDPREFGHTYWRMLSLGGAVGIGGPRKLPAAVGSTIGGWFHTVRWVERPYEILEAVGLFARVEGEREYGLYEVLGIGLAGHAEGSPWVQRALAWSNREDPQLELRDAKLDGVGLGWSELRGQVCPAEGATGNCESIGLEHRCELLDFSPDGKRMIGWCPPALALLERDGKTVLELIELPPSELRWRWVDGDTLALLGDDRNLRLISIAGGSLRETIPDVRQIYPLVAGGEFGLFAYRTGAGFHLRNVDGSRRFERSESVFAAAIDPSGEHVAVTDQKRIDIYEIATGTRVSSWRAAKLRKLAYRQDGAVLFGTQVRERGPTRAWDPKTGAEQKDAIPSAERARALADNPSWRFAWYGNTLVRALDGRKLSFDYGSAMLDNGLYEGEVPRGLQYVVLRRGDSIDDFVVYEAVDLAPALRREGLVAAFLVGEPLPEVIVGEHELTRLSDPARKVPSIDKLLDPP